MHSGLFFCLSGNIALLKDTFQKTTMDKFISSLAVDGNAKSNSSCARGSVTNDPWWVVDLKKEYTIQSIVIWNKIDGKYH